MTVLIFASLALLSLVILMDWLQMQEKLAKIEEKKEKLKEKIERALEEMKE